MELGLEQWLIIVSVWFQFLAAKSKDFWKPQKKYIQRRLLKTLVNWETSPFPNHIEWNNE